MAVSSPDLNSPDIDFRMVFGPIVFERKIYHDFYNFARHILKNQYLVYGMTDSMHNIKFKIAFFNNNQELSKHLHVFRMMTYMLMKTICEQGLHV